MHFATKHQRQNHPSIHTLVKQVGVWLKMGNKHVPRETPMTNVDNKDMAKQAKPKLGIRQIRRSCGSPRMLEEQRLWKSNIYPKLFTGWRIKVGIEFQIPKKPTQLQNTSMQTSGAPANNEKPRILQNVQAKKRDLRVSWSGKGHQEITNQQSAWSRWSHNWTFQGSWRRQGDFFDWMFGQIMAH